MINLNQNIDMDIVISNYAELVDFIKREDIRLEEAQEIVCKSLNVVCFPGRTKEQLIDSTEYYIDKFCNNNISRPIFLEQREYKLSIKDFYKK